MENENANQQSIQNLLIYNSKKLNSGMIWMLFLLFGWSYGSMGKMGTQILFYLTIGGFGLWGLVRLFTLSSSINDYNRKIALQCGLTPLQSMNVGL